MKSWARFDQHDEDKDVKLVTLLGGWVLWLWIHHSFWKKKIHSHWIKQTSFSEAENVMGSQVAKFAY